MRWPCHLILVLVLILLLKGCSLSPTLHVFNNARSPISFSVDGKRYVAAPRSSVSFTLEVPLEASVAGCELSYDTSYPPPEYVRTGMFRAHIQVQVEAGGKLYVLEPAAEPLIDASTYRQPEGWPATPEIKGECDWETGR